MRISDWSSDVCSSDLGETIDLGKFGLRLAEIWNLPLDERGDLTTNHLGRIETRARNPDFAESGFRYLETDDSIGSVLLRYLNDNRFIPPRTNGLFQGDRKSDVSGKSWAGGIGPCGASK